MRVALVNMPWARLDAASIQCGLLKAGLVKAGHEAEVLYPNLDLAAELGPDLYDLICYGTPTRVHLFGEWIFGRAAFGALADAADGDAYAAQFPEIVELLARAEVGWERVVELRERVLPGWVERVARDIADRRYDLVGLTSTFAQTVASIALARCLKELDPAQLVIAGGANFDGTMGPELVRAIPWLDLVVVGEGDRALPELVVALERGEDPVTVPGVCGRDAEGAVVQAAPRALIRDLDAVPFPDYDDYFETLDTLGRTRVLGAGRPRLLLEFSRGCWWGEKHHCTFCGLNALGMAYRARTPANALEQIESLMRRHRVRQIDAVDNILDMGYLGSLCEELAAADWSADLFFETKANLTRAQLGVLARAGVRQIQPGIESLSTHVLELMRKGSSKLLNVRLLKWARHYGIEVSWNLLVGFPGETDADYDEQIELMPLLAHLEPPVGVVRIWLERFSPYFTDATLGIGPPTPLPAYRFAYPLPELDLMGIAYFMDYPPADDTISASMLARLSDAVDDWQERWKGRPRPSLVYFRGPGWLSLRDTRGERPREATLDGWEADALLLCDDRPRTPAGVHRDLLTGGESGVSVADVGRLLDGLVAAGVCIEEDGKYLSLALPAR